MSAPTTLSLPLPATRLLPHRGGMLLLEQLTEARKTWARAEVVVASDGLFVDDSNHPEDYQGFYFFNHPKPPREDLPEERPFPYQPVQKITIRNLRTASGKPPRLPDGYTGTTIESDL